MYDASISAGLFGGNKQPAASVQVLKLLVYDASISAGLFGDNKQPATSVQVLKLLVYDASISAGLFGGNKQQAASVAQPAILEGKEEILEAELRELMAAAGTSSSRPRTLVA